MNKIYAVFKRELALYFRSPIAYAIAFALFLFFGLLYSDRLTQFNQQAPADGVNIVPNLLTFLMFLVAPLLTMRLVAEETREGTLETLMTLPISEGQFIIGKFLAVWGYYTVIILISIIYHLLLLQVGTPDAGRAAAMYFGAWLYGGAVLAITMIWSAVTEDQIVAAFLGAATVLVLYLAEVAASSIAALPDQNLATGLSTFIRELGLQAHYDQTMMQGVVRAEDVLYFILMMIGALFITTRIVEVRRWRS
jgi:ABC-2 type transport system permease protein